MHEDVKVGDVFVSKPPDYRRVVRVIEVRDGYFKVQNVDTGRKGWLRPETLAMYKRVAPESAPPAPKGTD